MLRNFRPEDGQFTSQEIEYIDKIEWLWQQLSPLQKSKIIYSVTSGTLKQGSDKHCFIAEAIGANEKAALRKYSTFDRVNRLFRSILYEGPSYDFVLGRKISIEEKKILNEIYYARVGKKEHQYHKATQLIRAYVASLMISIKE